MRNFEKALLGVILISLPTIVLLSQIRNILATDSPLLVAGLISYAVGVLLIFNVKDVEEK